MTAAARAVAHEQQHAAPPSPTRRRAQKATPKAPKAPRTEWWGLLAVAEEERRAGDSILRGRELRVWEAYVREVNADTGRCEDKERRPIAVATIARRTGFSIPTVYRALERLRDDRSPMPPHQGSGVRCSTRVKGRKPRDESRMRPPRPRRPDCAPRAEPLGLLHVERATMLYAACAFATRRECDAHHKRAKRAAERAGERAPMQCTHHHGGSVVWPAVRTAEEARAILDRAEAAGAELYDVARSGKRRAVENPSRRLLRTPVENPPPDLTYLSSDTEALSEASRDGSVPPPPNSVGGPVESETIDLFRARAPSGPCASPASAPSEPEAPSDAPLPGTLPDAAKPGDDARRGNEGRGARSGPTSGREHPAAYELGEILARWCATKTARHPKGLPLMRWQYETFVRRLSEGATLDELAFVVDGVALGRGEEAFARETADNPAAAAYASLETVHRYAAAGRKARREFDAALAQAWREARERRERATAEREATRSEIARVGAELRAELAREAAKPSSPPAGPPTRAEIARRKAEQLELLAREAARELEADATGDFLDVPIVRVAAILT